jgi:protease YdgD
VLAAGGVLVSSARAEPVVPRSELPGIGQADARQSVDVAADPWRSLGRIQSELGNRCTGTLIAPDQVLTAAHCLTSPRSRQLLQPGSVHFLLGYAAGRFTTHRRARSLRVGAGYVPERRGPASADWAVVTLEAPVDAKPLPWLPARRGDPVMLGGYQQDRPEVLMADTDCRILDSRAQEGGLLLLHDCAGTRGVSGAPLLRREAGGQWSVVGVAVAATRQRAGGIAASPRPGGG